MKKCPKCSSERALEFFFKSSKSKDGLQGYCKACVKTLSLERKTYFKEYRKENKERDRAYKKAYTDQNKERITLANYLYRIQNPDKVKASKTRYVVFNKEKVLASSKKYRESNPAKYAAYASKRRFAAEQAQPPWLTTEDKKRIELVWGLRELKSFLTGVEYEVDHIVPLQGKTVCGLHVPWNLQVILKTENRSKQARHWPDMWEI